MRQPLPAYPIQLDAKTTGAGAVGEILKVAALFLPPPFNLMVLGAGSLVTIGAWFLAKDRSAVLMQNPYDHPKTGDPV